MSSSSSTNDNVMMEEEDDEENIEEVDMNDLEEVTFENDLPPADEDDDVEVESQQPAIAAKEDGALVKFDLHTDSVYSIAIGNNNNCLSGGGDDVAYLWNIKTGNVYAKLEGHKDSIVDCGFNSESTLCATASYDGTVKIWDAGTGALVRTLEGPGAEIEWFKWHPTGNAILAGSSDTTAWVWDVSTGNCVCVLAGHEASVSCGSFTSNGRRVVTGSLDGSVKLWDPATSTCLHTFKGNNWHEYGVVSVACHPNEPIIAVGGQDGTVRTARLDTKKILASFQHDQSRPDRLHQNPVEGEEQPAPVSVETVAFSDSHPFLISGGIDGTIKVWDLSSQSCRHVCKHSDAVVMVKCVSSSLLFVSCSADGTCQLWDARSGQNVRMLTAHQDLVLGFAFLENTFVSCSDDKTCRVLQISES